MGQVTCPRCARQEYTEYGGPYDPYRDPPFPALSRVDNETYICTACGQDEAMRDFTGAPPVPPDEWPIRAKPEFGYGAKATKPDA